MYLVTGGSGFLGSHIIAELEQRGIGPIAVVDELGTDARWRNLAKHTIDRFLRPDELATYLRFRGQYLTAIVHMGAISSTTEADAQALIDANVQSFRRVWNAASKHGIPLIYASSASVYGLDARCVDDDSPEALRALRPVNAYGWSKKVCDENGAAWSAKGHHPPFWMGLRFFNAYGANEGHKGEQRSYVSKAIEAGLMRKPIKLFPGLFARDWVYALDISRLVADVLGGLVSGQGAPPSGVYNVGSGEAVSFADVAGTVGREIGTPLDVEIVEMPESMRAGYQPQTCADLTKLRAAMPDFKPTPLAEGVGHYLFAYGGSGWDSYR